MNPFTLQERYDRIHCRLTEHNRVYHFIRTHEPKSGAGATFFSYQTIAKFAGLHITDKDNLLDEARDYVECELDSCFDFLADDCGLAVQFDANKGGVRGIRVLKTD